MSLSAIDKIGRRLLPLLFALYFVNFLDRVNVGYAALQMNGDLGFTPAVYGLGASIFFLGYFFLEIPSNWITTKIGARKWLARIAITWGVAACAMAFVQNQPGFYALRFILGVAEAGFVPAMLFYVASWFPQASRANAVAQLWTATAFALIFGGPLSALTLSISGAGLHGWQWMFLIEGVPSIVLGLLTLKYLPDDIASAAWLEPAERDDLARTLAAENAAVRTHGVAEFRAALAKPIVWGFSITYYFLGIGFFGITFWLPQIVKQFSGLGPVETSLVSSVPFIFAAIAMLIVGRRSRTATDHRMTFVIGTLIGAAGVLASTFSANAWISLIALTIGAMGIWSVVAIFWAASTRRMAGTGAAAGFALMNTIGALGGFTGPYMIGLVRGATGSFTIALIVIAVALLVCALLALVMMRLPANTARPATVPV